MNVIVGGLVVDMDDDHADRYKWKLPLPMRVSVSGCMET